MWTFPGEGPQTSSLENLASLGGSAGEESTCNAGDLGSIPGLGRSPGEGKGYPLQYSGLENPMDCIGPGVTKSRTRLSDFKFQFSVWRPWMGYLCSVPDPQLHSSSGSLLKMLSGVQTLISCRQGRTQGLQWASCGERAGILESDIQRRVLNSSPSFFPSPLLPSSAPRTSGTTSHLCLHLPMGLLTAQSYK